MMLKWLLKAFILRDNVIVGLLGGIFSEQSPVSNRLNEVISNALEEVEKKEEK